LGVARKLGTAAGRIAIVNGEPAVVLTQGGAMLGVLALDVAGEKIRGVYYVANPDKLVGPGF
jgi:RNA polymerase sigma-70 factor (ECF subfamily)